MARTIVGRLARTAGIFSGTLVLLVASAAVAADRYWPPIVDPATGRHTPGRWVWADLVTADVAKAADFYGKVFGWTFETYGGTDDRETYTLALASGLPIGGMLYDARALQGDTPSARWIGLVSVADPRAAAAAVAQHGGKVIYAPTMLGERGAPVYSFSELTVNFGFNCGQRAASNWPICSRDRRSLPAM